LKKLTATRVAQHLDISVPTLTNWYRWYNNPDYDKPSNVPELPKYEQNGKRATRYWKEEDLPKLIKFRDWVPKGRAGIMGEHNAQFWGDRGKRALKNKEMKDGLQKS
jgi:hypothetical protein